MTDRGNFLYNSLSKSSKYDLRLLGAISFTIPYQNHEMWPMTARGHFLYNSLSNSLKCAAKDNLLTYSLSESLKYDLWLLGAIFFIIPYQNHWNMTYDWLRQFPLQFLIKIIEIYLVTARDHLLDNSLSKSLKYDLWLLEAIGLTIPHQNNWNMTYDCSGPFPLLFLIKSTEIWTVKAWGHFLEYSV